MNSDISLAHIDADEMRERIARDIGLTLKEFAVGYGFSYSAAKLLAKKDGFPLTGNLVFPSDFRLWRRRRSGWQSAPDSAAHRPRRAAGKRGELRVKHG